jgi:predicted O-methyltransferase YrrM
MQMTSNPWTTVDTYIEETLGSEDAVLTEAHELAQREGLPEIQLTPNQGQLLKLLAEVQGATRILEIGTLGGYSTIWLARALPDNGHLVTIELEPHHAKVASANIERAGLSGRVELRVGRAVDVLEAMVNEGSEPFDFVFIDADKASYPAYLDLSLRLSRPGTLIFADNVIRNGGVARADTGDENVNGAREMLGNLSGNPRLSAAAVQTVGTKGWDGFALIRVVS